MASALPDARLSESSAAREVRIAERTTVLGLEQLLAKAWMIYAFVPCAVLMAYLAATEGEPVWALVWLAAMIARDIYAWFQIKRLRRASLEPTAAVVRELQLGFVVVGILAVALLPVFFARSNNSVLLIVIVLVSIHVSGTRELAGGILRVWFAYGLVMFGALIAGWLWRGGFLGLVSAGLTAAFFPLTVFAIQTRRREMLHLVRALDINETLSGELTLERDRAQAERDRAEAASASKTRFFAAASHDLRQPLHALSINATTLDLVARRSGDPLLKEVSQGISSALRQSTGLLDGLLDISRLDAHAVKLRLAPHDMGAVLATVREEYAALAAQHGLTLEVELDVDASAALWALTDIDQLVRILGNLVDNAIKFTREGGIMLSARRDAPNRVLIRVSDTGPGIAQAERERVFEEFYQIGNLSRDRAQGLGLGLAIVKRTAALLEVSLKLISEPGRGTTFELSLPPANPGVAGGSPEADLNAGKPLSVLLVDDEPEVLASLCTYLRQIGWTARGVASGAEAQQALAKGFQADVLVVDYRLRDETGLDVITRLRAVHPGLPALPAVIVTGDTTAQRLREFDGLGVSVLHKPVDGEKLARTLVETFKRRL
jgi:signal transduction histidine kinase/CheY-like chemotaxis protein